MKMDEFINGCPITAHITGFNFGKELEVRSAKGCDIKDGKPGNLAIVWNKYGKAYTRKRTENLRLKDFSTFIYFHGQYYGRNKKFDIKFEKEEKK